MPQRKTIKPDEVVDAPATVEDHEKAVKEAQKAFDNLLKERRKNRNSMSRLDFRKYNDDTLEQQVEVQETLRNAERALSRALGREEQRVEVKTAKESSEAN